MTGQFIIGHEGWIANVTEEDARAYCRRIFETREMVFLLELFGEILGILIEICAAHLKGLL